MGRRLKRKPRGRQGVERQHRKASEIFKDDEKAGSLQARAEEIETLLLEKLERWEMLEGKQNGEGF